MMTSFTPKTSQSNNTSSRPSASSGLDVVSSANLSSAHVNSTNTPVSSFVSSPSSLISTPVPSKIAITSGVISTANSIATRDPATVLPNVAADSPQFNLKQGAISVQGLLGLQSFSSNTLDTVSSVSSSSFKSAITSQVIDDPNLSTGLAGKVTNSQPNTAPTEQVPAQEVAKPSVAESFASIYGDEADENSIVKQMDEDDSVAQTKQNDQQSSDVDAAITKQAQSEQESKQQNQDAIKQQEQQLAQKTEKIEAAQVNQLSKRDTEVKTHEQAHAAVGGVHAQSPSFTYEKGPDGKRYAVDGEVQIDVSVVNGDAQATLNKMMKVYSAAMAPVQPSMADIRVAAEALQKMNAAREELAIERQQSVIELDDVDHIIGLGEKMKTSQQEEQFSQLEPFKKSPDDPLISISGIDNTESKANSRNTSSSVQSHASLAYHQASNASLNNSGAVRQASKINAYV